jgi:radical SAM superfamily enzyme YgiQ (UPF0313 family)
VAMVAGALAREGHEVDQFDFLVAGQSFDQVRDRIRQFNPRFVCIGIRNLDNCDSLTRTTYPALVKEIVDVVKACSGLPVILGGAAFSLMPDAFIALTGADHGVVGEGERALCALIADLEAGRPAPVLVKDPGLLQGCDMGSPLYSGELSAYYLGRSGMINIQTKRGCPQKCIYCSYPQLEGGNLRLRDPRAVVDDMERAHRDQGVSSFFITDSIFNDGEGHYLAIVDEMLRRDLGLSWSCYLRPQGLGRKEIAHMMRAGLQAVELGTDAACDRTLHALGKGLTFREVVEVNDACGAEHLPCAHFVMFGGPGETPETLEEGLANLEALDRCVAFAFSGIRIHPDTALRLLAIREGMITAETNLFEPVYYFSPHIDPAAMNDRIYQSFRKRRDRFFPPEEAQERQRLLIRMGYKGLIWDTLLRDRPTLAPAL